MAIRPAHDDDFDAIASITNHYIVTTSIHFAYESLTPADLRSKWHGGRERYPWFVTEAEGVVLGYAKAGEWRDRAAYRWTCETGIYMAPEARGKGLGKALYTVLLDELARRGFRSAVAGITLPNGPSVALHEQLGFEYIGTFPDAGFKFETWHALGWWQKRFAR